MVAPNGARRTKLDHPALPLTSREIADEARACAAAGATAIHLHVRDEHGGHTLDVDRYNDAIAAVRQVTGSDLVIQISTESVGRFSVREQMDCVRALRPPAIRLRCGKFWASLMPGTRRSSSFTGWLANPSVCKSSSTMPEISTS